MAINVSQAFHRTSANPIDDTIALTKAEMLTVNDNLMPSKYFTVCQDDGNFYLYDKSNTADPTTGKFRVFEGGGGGSYTAGDGIDITNDVISTKQSEEGDIDEIIDVYPQAGNLVSIVNAFNRGDIYSTDEKMIGQYIDGKPLYQKTISCGALPNNTTKVISIGTNIDTIVDVKGIASRNGAILTIPRCYTNSTYNIDVSVSTISGELSLVTAFDYSSYNAYVTIQYTKTTDTAISIGSETEYSTDEKVVGTWIDGRPIYQRTYEQEIALTPNTWVASSLVATNVDKLINGIGYNAGSSIDCLLSGVVNGYFGFNSTRSQSITINAFTVQYLKTT